MSESQNTNLDIIATGLENIDQGISKIEEETRRFDEMYPKLKAREKSKKILYIVLSTILFFALEIIAMATEDYIWFICLILIYCGAIYIIVNLKQQSKADIGKGENDKQKKVLEFNVQTRNDIKLLLEKKDSLYDFYITSAQQGHLFIYVAPELNEKYEEEGRFHSIYVDELKIVKDGKYSTLIVEPKLEWASGYKITLEMPYELFKKSATWLK